MLFYPVYAVLFAETGLSAAEISSLFAIWSVTAFILEVPSGVWADVVSRRLLLTVAPALTGAGFALWTFVPSYPSFAAGFVLWGAGGAMRSGALQALVYTELGHLGAPGAYARLLGRSQAVGTTAAMIATALAAPVFAAGGYHAVGIASVAVTLFGVAAGWCLPESRDPSNRETFETGEKGVVAATTAASSEPPASTQAPEPLEPLETAETAETAVEAPEATYTAVLRSGLVELRRTPPVRRAVLFVAVLMGVSALDEYIPLLAQSTGADPATVSLLMVLVMVGAAIGGWAAGRDRRWAAPALTTAAGCLATGAVIGHPAGMVFVAVAFGIVEWAIADADARLQERIADDTRATVTSMAGLGAEVVAMSTFAMYALGSTWAQPGLLFTVAAVPYLALALAMWRARHNDSRE